MLPPAIPHSFLKTELKVVIIGGWRGGGCELQLSAASFSKNEHVAIMIGGWSGGDLQLSVSFLHDETLNRSPWHFS